MFENVLIGVDGRSGGRDAIALARQLAAPAAQITLVHVYGDWRGGGLTRAVGRWDSEQLLLREQAGVSSEAERASVFGISAGRGLHELAEQRAADLLVIGSCSHGLLGRVLMGDDTSGALNGAPCAIAVAPLGYCEAKHPLQRIGIGHAGSPEDEQALEVARELAARHRATLSALSVVSLHSVPAGKPIPANWPELAGQLVDQELRRLGAIEGVDGDSVYGEPGEELCAFGAQLELLIVGSRGYGPIGRLLNGSTSSYLARRARCPLLVIPRTAHQATTTNRTSRRSPAPAAR